MAKTMTEHEFSDCLQKNKIVNFAAAKKLVGRELKAAQDDLKAASQSLRDDREKWATVQAYYAMFHTARALLLFIINPRWVKLSRRFFVTD